jgi:hypothetical protein
VCVCARVHSLHLHSHLHAVVVAVVDGEWYRSSFLRSPGSVQTQTGVVWLGVDLSTCPSLFATYNQGLCSDLRSFDVLSVCIDRRCVCVDLRCFCNAVSDMLLFLC